MVSLACIVQAITVILTVFTSPTGGQITNGGFASFCAFTGAILVDGHLLGMYCENNDIAIFGYNYTWIDLDYCIGNYIGMLRPQEFGHYSASCRGCIINFDSTLWLDCICPDLRHLPVHSTIDLNTTLFDYDGALGCFRVLGNKTREGPPLPNN